MLSYAEENRQLFERARNGDNAAYERLADLNMKLVHNLAGRLSQSTGLEYDELVGAGCLGLTKAIQSFDADRGFAFSTYAFPIITGEMKRLLRDTGPIKVSRDIKERAVKISRISRDIEQKQGRSPTPGELAGILGCSVDDILLSLDAARAPVSLEGEGDEEGLFGCVGREDRGLNIESLSLKEAIGSLPKQDASIIALRYYSGLTQRQTADRLSLTQVQVSRREKKILEQLREYLSEDDAMEILVK